MRAFAYRLLGRREYSIQELGSRLRQKWPHAEGVTELVEALAEENLVSDERFTESFVRSRMGRHQGPLKIRAELRARGISDPLISSELGTYDGRWTELACEWLARQHPGEIDFKTRQKFYRRLANRGFTHDQAMAAINKPPSPKMQ
jgi:regulatory protein